MVFEKEGNTITIVIEKSTVNDFITDLTDAFNEIKENHIIINLLSFDVLTLDKAIAFMSLSRKHRSAKKSFVLVTNQVSYDDVPEELCIVPTIQEAKDFIEMEEIERDLGL